MPRVAETSVRSAVVNVTGRAPVCRTSASFFASPSEAPPMSICAPLSPGIPSGLRRKSMYGTDWICRSSTIAKCCAQRWTASGLLLPAHASEPRCASRFVISWKTFLPFPVNCISTTGAFVCGSMSARVPDSFSSLPVISGIGLFGKSAGSRCFSR